MSVERLSESDSPALATIKMQVAFDETSIREHDQLVTDTSARNEKVASLLEDIVATRPRGAAANEALYRKVLAYACLSARIDQSDTASMRACSAALESVLPRSEISSLASLAAKPKTSQLQELANIVAGILLFNMSTNRGGAFIEDGMFRVVGCVVFRN
jgi:hypothetical protein